MNDKDVGVLLVEDDEVAVMAVRRALRKAEMRNHLTVARDGIEALEILRGTDEVAPLERPFIILLDLNLPRMSGHEFLDELREDEGLRDSVVFVLTTSDEHADKFQAYQRFVAGYIRKTPGEESYRNLMDLLAPYWKVVDLPD
jgi:CheY-like chemotaxis protein